MKHLTLSLTSAFLVSTLNIEANPWEDFFTIEKISLPEGVDPQIGGLDITPSNKLAICFHRGEVYTYDDTNQEWNRFAEGLHEPLGILAESDTSFIIGQRPEISRITDSDGDNKADFYQTLFDDFGMSGNYHEFNFGPTRGEDGSFYIALGTASNFGRVEKDIRGDWSPVGGFSHEDFLAHGEKDDWKKFREAGNVSRMYSRVPYRGWVLKVAPDGKSYEPYASGFRTPNGIFMTPDQKLYITDNQGDWLGMSKLFYVEKDKFYGHPVSLAWTNDWGEEAPHKLPPSKFDAMRTKEAAFLPSGDLANSPTGMAVSPGMKEFGLRKGDLIIGEMNQKRLVRFLPDEVNGVQQGTTLGFIEGEFLGMGNNRIVFDKNNQLYVGKTHLSWAGAEGLVKVKWNGKPYLHITENKLTKEGFEMHFSHPVQESLSELSNIQISHYGLNYNHHYGSNKIEEKTVLVSSIDWSNNGKTASITLEEAPQKARVYDIRLNKVIATDVGALLGTRLFYTTSEVLTEISTPNETD